ncbi:CST complex subunit Ten1 [Kalaharituber pfeilii]|nr:CST complex subunit Ten1 [Kalaharituber pfeilii]
MSLGPNPASLTLLENLAQFPLRSKVRFLGCIKVYHSASSTLIVTHTTMYKSPSSSSSSSSLSSSLPRKTKTATVDIAIVVEQIRIGELQIGDWVNVLGYITDMQADGATVCIQGIQIWSAGGIDLGKYERQLREKENVDRRSLDTLPTVVNI